MSQAYENFIAALEQKSPETKRTYAESFKHYLKFNETEDAENLLKFEQKDLQQKIRDFMQDLKESNLSYSSINKAYWAVRKFYAANEVMVNRDWVELYKPKRESREEEDRPYTKDEVRACISKADQLGDLRVKAAIMIMATSGVRVGALPDIRIKDLEYLESYKLYCLTIYPLDAMSKYRTFLTPQASEIVTKMKGKKQDKEPLLTSKRDSDIPISKVAIQVDIWRLLQRVGMREVTSALDRKNVKLAHGFRKFATTTWAKCGLDKEFRQLLDGQNPGVQKSYAKLTPLELIETSKYPLAIDALTF